MRSSTVYLLLILFLLSLSIPVAGYPVVNECGASQEYVQTAVRYLREAYDAYCRDIRCPALCPDFHVVLRNMEYGGLAYTRTTPYVCTYRIDLACNLGGWLKPLAYHEMAHALQAAYADVIRERGYGWWTEAHAEGLTSYYVARDGWQNFGHVRRFFDRELWRKDPFSYTDWAIEWYQYGAYFAWLAWRYGPKNSTEVYASQLHNVGRIYINFLLSPWDWGREPRYDPYCTLSVEQMDRYTGLYCAYRDATQGRVYVVSSKNQLVNVTVAGNELRIALAALSKSEPGYTVTTSLCPQCPQTVTTVTTTVTSTVTSTVERTVTSTVDRIVTTTTTVPVTVTQTVTLPITTTIEHIVTTTVTSPTTATVTVTLTEPVTTTVTTTIAYVVNRTTTLPITVTETHTATRTINYTTTVTERVGGVSYDVVAVLVLLALAVGCMVCSRFLARRS